MSTHPRYASKARGPNKRVQFTPKLWEAWHKAREPDEHSRKLAHDIDEFRQTLAKLENQPSGISTSPR